MGKSKPKSNRNDYLASMAYGICHGPVDAIHRIRLQDTTLFLGTRDTSGTLDVDDPDFFGGDSSGGGVEGAVEVRMGGWAESVSTRLVSRLARLVTDTPAFRGLATIMFFGNGSTGGFWFGSNTYSIPPADVTVSDSAKGPSGGEAYELIYPEGPLPPPPFSSAGGGDDDEEEAADEIEAEWIAKLPGANPAYIIYELMTSADYGASIDPSTVNTTSIISAAARLYDEGFGLHFSWTAQMKVKAFIQEVLDHVRGFLFVDPEDGLWTMRLLREDIDYDNGLVVTPGNADLTNRRRLLWGETANEVVVTYTDPQSEEEASVSAVNLASIAVQNGVVNSETRNYKGVKYAPLAQSLADRDLAELSIPLYSAKVVGTREFWSVRPGDTMELVWPEDGIESMTVRVMKIEQNRTDKAAVGIEVTEDLFSASRTQLVAPQTSLAEPVKQAPRDLPVAIPVAMPLPQLIREGATTVELSDGSWPAVPVGFIVDDSARSVVDVKVVGPIVQPDGSTSNGQLLIMKPGKSRQIGDALIEEAISTFPKSLIDTLVYRAPAGTVFMLGDEETGSELVMIYGYNEAATDAEWQVKRGIWDTQPRAWDVATQISVLPQDMLELDPEERVDGDTVNYRFQPFVDGRRLPLSEATIHSYDVRDRPILPFRPANCQIEGNGFGGVDYSLTTPPATIDVTWANRNRTREDSSPPSWTAATTTPEDGQTTTLRIVDNDGTLVYEETGLTGTSHTFDLADFGSSNTGEIRFLSERDGYESWEYVARPYVLYPSGYGYDYGLSYGKKG